jgi:hypothetical protein
MMAIPTSTAVYFDTSINPAYYFDPLLATRRVLALYETPTAGWVTTEPTYTYDPELDLAKVGIEDVECECSCE